MRRGDACVADPAKAGWRPEGDASGKFRHTGARKAKPASRDREAEVRGLAGERKT
jgi:hypothetical protein